MTTPWSWSCRSRTCSEFEWPLAIQSSDPFLLGLNARSRGELSPSYITASVGDSPSSLRHTGAHCCGLQSWPSAVLLQEAPEVDADSVACTTSSRNRYCHPWPQVREHGLQTSIMCMGSASTDCVTSNLTVTPRHKSSTGTDPHWDHTPYPHLGMHG